MKRWLAYLLLFAAFVTIALSFHQPPMRLMPTPAILLADPALVPRAPEDNRIELFYATNRLPVGPRSNRLYAVVPGRDLHLGVATLRIGEPDLPSQAIDAVLGGDPGQRPHLNLLTLAELATLPEDSTLTPGTRAWLGLVNEALAASPDKEIILYVHGANSTVERAAGQAAQLRHMAGGRAVVILFAWPTAENFFRYSRDIETAFGAAPQLVRLVALLARHSDARSIDLLSYSAGAVVASDGLAALGRRADARTMRLGEIHHAAPDADFRGFVDDLRDYAKAARRVTVSANLNDSALRLSQTINRASRAGRPDLAELSPNATRWLLEANRTHGLEVIRIKGEDIPAMSSRSHAFWYDDPWVSSDVLVSMLFHLPADRRALQPTRFDNGAIYWRFPPDYPARLPQVIASARAVSAGSAPAPESAAPAR